MSRAWRLRAALATLFALAFAACNESRCVTVPCGQRTECVRTAINIVSDNLIGFEDCTSGSCPSITSLQNASVVPSYHPSEHALRISEEGDAQLRFVLSRVGTGQSIDFLARCDRGALLSVGLTSLLPGGLFNVSVGLDWRRVSATLRAPSMINVPGQSPDTVMVTFRVNGTGSCQIDRAILNGLTETCTQYETFVSSCESCETRSWYTEDAGVWGPRLDAGGSFTRD